MAENAQRIPIHPVAPPLSHLRIQESAPASKSLDRTGWRLILGSGALLTLAVGLILLLGAKLQPDNRATIESPATAVQTPQTAAPAQTSSAPYAEIVSEQAKAAAQRALEQFVEQQLAVEAELTAISDAERTTYWRQQDIDTAKTLALAGDEQFINEQYAQAAATYTQAQTQLTAVLDEAEAEFQAHLNNAVNFIDRLNSGGAAAALRRASEIKAKDPRLAAAKARYVVLDQVIQGLRDARNHELAERFEEAVLEYRKILALDAQTPDLNIKIDNADRSSKRQKLNAALSQGLLALEQQQFTAARAAFTLALGIAPDNDIAAAGLEQVVQLYDISRVVAAEKAAQAAMQAEQWQEAQRQFENMLAIDSNIQSANAGLINVRALKRLETQLRTIINEPGKLANPNLLAKASAVLAEAKTTQGLGPMMQDLVASASSTMTEYSEPVEVTLLSDNATQISVSNVGTLTPFASKKLILRPGRYTFRGSQIGCRDIYESVLILPGIQPLDLRCKERLAQ